ncbi:sulfate adenylyltransferase subunit CysD [SAR86 cluster bacterium]|nr:sulfate adenylyltransferase subunit CysD [SAR86 cluster bacterium]
MKTHIETLESESIHIIREAFSEAKNPVMLYSLGKDSSVMLHLAKKAFFPGKIPFPLLHVDTLWKFKEMYAFRDKVKKENDLELIVFTNPEGRKNNINPLKHGSEVHTDIMKTQALKMALDNFKFDVAYGGARRDEEKSRAKERIFSFRSEGHRWDPKNQRPELWNIFNCRKKENETIRVFPLSNWTELDIWQYIYQENIEIVPLYFASKRKIIERDGMLIDVNDDRLDFKNDEVKELNVRFRTLGCYPLTGAIESNAANLEEIMLEILKSTVSERQGRAIDKDANASMEQKKQEGYF